MELMDNSVEIFTDDSKLEGTVRRGMFSEFALHYTAATFMSKFRQDRLGWRLYRISMAQLGTS